MSKTVVEIVLRQDIDRLRADNSLLATMFQNAMDLSVELLKALEAYAEEFGETGYYRAAMNKIEG